MINRNFFFDHVRLHLFNGSLKTKQFNGLTMILDEWERATGVQDDRWLAYMFATAHHETDKTIQPINEYGKGAGKQYGKIDPDTGQKYFGRGFVQLTWRYNYEAMDKEPAIKTLLATQHASATLTKNAELALDPAIATQVMFIGMRKGIFTGKKLSDYFNSQKEDWINARRIINGTDKANLIAGYGKAYYAAISYTT
jgi:hypothetical protein